MPDGPPPRRLSDLLRGRVADVVVALGEAEPRVRRTVSASTDAADLADDELLLRRDVLDTQIVDVDGRRVVRVGDVLLEPDGDALRVVAVDVGFGSVCHRLGLRRLARRLGVQALPWAELHLTSPRAHRLQLGTTGARLHRLDADELTFLVAAVSVSSGADVLRARGEPAGSLDDRVRQGVPKRRFRRHRARRHRHARGPHHGSGRGR